MIKFCWLLLLYSLSLLVAISLFDDDDLQFSWLHFTMMLLTLIEGLALIFIHYSLTLQVPTP